MTNRRVSFSSFSRETLRESDVLSYEANRFMVLLPHTKKEGRDIVKRRIKHILKRSDLPPFTVSEDHP